MQLKTSVNKQGQIYIPSKVRNAIGIPLDKSKEVTLIGDMYALFIIPSELSPDDAVRSWEVIGEHLKHQQETKKQKGEPQQ